MWQNSEEGKKLHFYLEIRRGRYDFSLSYVTVRTNDNDTENES
jgi:hypothetical protein